MAQPSGFAGQVDQAIGQYVASLVNDGDTIQLGWGGIPDAAAAIKADGGEDLYVVTCFSDRDKLLNLPDVKKEG